MKLYRAQVMLEEHQHRTLQLRALDSGRSMSDLVREAVDGYLARAAETEATRCSLAAVEGLAHLRRTIGDTHGVVDTTFLEVLREERDAELAP